MDLGRLRLTSPGILLIFAVLAAGGIFLLDAFYIRPRMRSQQTAALCEQGVRAQAVLQQSLSQQRRRMRETAAAAAEEFRPQRRDLSLELLRLGGAHLAWLTDAAGSLRASWSVSADGEAEVPERLPGIEPGGAPDAGLMALPGGKLGMVARAPLGDAESPGGFLWVARKLDRGELGPLGRALGGEAVFVSTPQLPPAAVSNPAASHSFWMIGEDTLAVGVPVQNLAGRRLGYIRLDVPVVQIHQQAAASRRTGLIVMALSMGLALLVIVGAHILVTGPVLRLLNRIQRVEAGEAFGAEFSSSLHGEPLMLARRLENAFDRLAHMSKTDQLTGLANRRHFEEVLEAFYHQSRRYNRPLSVITMDIDFFKAINDTGGHAAGDELLKIVSRAIEEASRKADLPARLGGDEFAVLLPETTAAGARGVAERIVSLISDNEVVVNNALKLHVTCSIGIADLNAGEISHPDDMLALADRALYQAKEKGRNRIEMAHDVTGLTWNGDAEVEEVDTLCRKLAGLDNEFKGLFIRGVEEIVLILEQRDPHMADHARKVQHYAMRIGEEMELPERVLKRIQIAAMFHDIGMLALPDSVLLCPGELNDAQQMVMRNHPLLGVRIMEGMEFLEQEIPAVRYHHENWDGSGYPEGIRGATIPLTARIVAVADAFDAMTSPRAFRGAKSVAEALQELREAAGRQFDPAVVDSFFSVAERLGDALMEIPGRGQSLMPLLSRPEGIQSLMGSGRGAK